MVGDKDVDWTGFIHMVEGGTEHLLTMINSKIYVL